MRKWKRGGNELGQGTVEFALIVPIFLVVVLFIVEAGWVIAQRTAFYNGCIYSSWSVSAADVGDFDTLAETPSRKVYTRGVGDTLIEKIRASNIWGLIPENVTVKNAQAVFYNKEDTFDIPGKDPSAAVSAVARTRYMDLHAEIKYEIYPLTFVGRILYGDLIILEKDYETTKVVASLHRS